MDIIIVMITTSILISLSIFFLYVFFWLSMCSVFYKSVGYIVYMFLRSQYNSSMTFSSYTELQFFIFRGFCTSLITVVKSFERLTLDLITSK
jgi:hypothetical protein